MPGVSPSQAQRESNDASTSRVEYRRHSIHRPFNVSYFKHRRNSRQSGFSPSLTPDRLRRRACGLLNRSDRHTTVGAEPDVGHPTKDRDLNKCVGCSLPNMAAESLLIVPNGPTLLDGVSELPIDALDVFGYAAANAYVVPELIDVLRFTAALAKTLMLFPLYAARVRCAEGGGVPWVVRCSFHQLPFISISL